MPTFREEEKCIASRLLTYFNLCHPKLAVELERNSLCRAVRFANFEGISTFPVPSIILAETQVMFICTSSKGHGL